MLKISRNFCRYSSLLSFYSYVIILSEDQNKIILVNGFYDHLSRVIKNAFSVIKFTEFMLVIIKEHKHDVSKINILNLDIFQLEEYKKILSRFNVFDNTNFDITNSILNPFIDYLNNSDSLQALIFKVSQNNEILNALDIDQDNISKNEQNIITQIINNFGQEILNDIVDIENLTKTNYEFCDSILNELKISTTEIKNIIETYSKNWLESRVHLIEKIIIGLAVAEYRLYKTPIQVIINEYINLTKEYCGNKSSFFVNGLLDPIIKNLSKNEVL